LVSAAFFLEYLKCVLEWKGLEVLEEKALKVLEFCRTFGVGTLPLVYLVHHMYQLYKKPHCFLTFGAGRICYVKNIMV